MSVEIFNVVFVNARKDTTATDYTPNLFFSFVSILTMVNIPDIVEKTCDNFLGSIFLDRVVYCGEMFGIPK